VRVCPVRPVGLFFLASHHGRCDAGSTRIYSVRWLLVDLDVLVFVGSVLFGCADSTRDVTAWDAVLCVCVFCRLSAVESLCCVLFRLLFLFFHWEMILRIDSNRISLSFILYFHSRVSGTGTLSLYMVILFAVNPQTYL